MIIEYYMTVFDLILCAIERIDKELMFSTKLKANLLNVETLKN